MSEPQAQTKNSIGDLFSKDELKSFFIKYLVMTGFIEMFIFFVCYLSTFKPYSSQFPWREYFYAAFIIPIAITLLLGVIAVAFNAFFQAPGQSDHLSSASNDDASVSMSKTKLFLRLSKQLQFLLFLLGLGLTGVLMFRMNDIFALFAQAGEKAFGWLLVCLGGLVAGILVFGTLYLWFHYKLIKKRMEYVNQYKLEMMSRLGLLVLEDKTVIDRDGNVIYRHTDAYDDAGQPAQVAADSISLLPPIVNSRRKAE